MKNYEKPFGMVKNIPRTHNVTKAEKIILVGKKDPTVYAQYAFFKFHDGAEKIIFKCCGGAILGGLKAIAILSSLVGDMEIEDFKLSQHVDNESRIHTKIEITVINPKYTSEPKSGMLLENL